MCLVQIAMDSPVKNYHGKFKTGRTQEICERFNGSQNSSNLQKNPLDLYKVFDFVEMLYYPITMRDTKQNQTKKKRKNGI